MRTYNYKFARPVPSTVAVHLSSDDAVTIANVLWDLCHELERPVDKALEDLEAVVSDAIEGCDSDITSRLKRAEGALGEDIPFLDYPADSRAILRRAMELFANLVLSLQYRG